MKTPTNAAILAVVLTMLAAGCVTKVETLEGPHPETSGPTPAASQPPAAGDKRVVIDDALQSSIRVVGIKENVSPQGYLKIQVNVENLTDSLKEFSYRIDWFESNGTPVPAASAPFPWLLLKRETSFLAAAGPTTAARQFRVVFLPDAR